MKDHRQLAIHDTTIVINVAKGDLFQYRPKITNQNTETIHENGHISVAIIGGNETA